MIPICQMSPTAIRQALSCSHPRPKTLVEHPRDAIKPLAAFPLSRLSEGIFTIFAHEINRDKNGIRFLRDGAVKFVPRIAIAKNCIGRGLGVVGNGNGRARSRFWRLRLAARADVVGNAVASHRELSIPRFRGKYLKVHRLCGVIAWSVAKRS